VELLAVIGIIVLLVGILVPTVMSARRQADKNACRMELQTIALALDAYRADFGDYPHPPANERCVRVLAWALIGPYNAKGANGDPTYPFGVGFMTDGADGPGFRTVYDSTTNKGGKVWGPYLPPDKFHLVLPDTPTNPPDLKWDILDRYGSPIEYFPRWRKYKAGQNMYLFGKNSTPNDPANADYAIYDYRQQWQPSPPGKNPPFNYPAANYFRKALGDDNLNDLIDGAEAAKEMPPFLLISKGQYKMYSTNSDIQNNFARCDEITNLQH
jgi:type II secretory pathway pseudopilin PulG